MLACTPKASTGQVAVARMNRNDRRHPLRLKYIWAEAEGTARNALQRAIFQGQWRPHPYPSSSGGSPAMPLGQKLGCGPDVGNAGSSPLLARPVFAGLHPGSRLQQSHACRACTAAPPHADSSRILRVSENRTSQCNFQKPRKSKDMLSLVNSFVESLMALEEAPRGQEKYLSLSLHWKAGASSTSHLLALQSAPGPRLFEGSAACSCYCAKVQKRKAFSCSESKSCNWQPMTYACHPHADAAR